MARSVYGDAAAPNEPVAVDPATQGGIGSEDEVDEADKGLAALGYAPVSRRADLTNDWTHEVACS